MKYYPLFLLPVLGACSSTPTTSSATVEGPAPAPAASTGTVIDQQNGFLGHHFGDDLATFRGLTRTPVQPVHPGVMYAAPQVPTTFGPATVLNVRHFFLDGKYYKTTLEAPGEQAARFRAEAVRQYGPGREVGRQVWWQGERAVATAQVGADQVLTFTIYDKQVQPRAEAPAVASR